VPDPTLGAALVARLSRLLMDEVVSDPEQVDALVVLVGHRLRQPLEDTLRGGKRRSTFTPQTETRAWRAPTASGRVQEVLRGEVDEAGLVGPDLVEVDVRVAGVDVAAQCRDVRLGVRPER
jgi:hypothetical protein